MTLHLFNPEHDIALAANLSNFTAPHAGRQLRHDLGFLPVLWATADDLVVVDDVDVAAKALRRVWPRIKGETALREACQRLVSVDRLPQLPDDASVSPWGWDAALKAQLLRKGLPKSLLPTDGFLADVRQLSHRNTAAMVLRGVRGQYAGGMVGEAVACTTREAVADALARWPQVVLKMPWSSSGRGLRFLSADTAGMHEGWIKNVLRMQGCLMAEPYYNKVKDFGMEFSCDEGGNVAYLGLSLFHTTNGAYTGNIVATEQAKTTMLERYIPEEKLVGVRQHLCRFLSQQLGGRHYVGPLGVDMMIVADGQGREFFLHPCVEINLRRTMGHVALSLNNLINKDNDNEMQKVMRIAYEDCTYKLKIER